MACACLALATTTIIVPSLAGGIYSTISVGPDTPGWYNEAGLTSTIVGGFDGTQNSLAASGTGKNQFYISGADLFGGSSLTIGDIASITCSMRPRWSSVVTQPPWTQVTPSIGVYGDTGAP